MIKRLKIKNIQSHKDSELLFDNNVNVIIGSSNQGKSAILRALYFVRYNRPLGIDTLANHSIIDNKHNLTDDMIVEVENDNYIVARKKNSLVNQYLINNEVFNVVKTDVPNQVLDCLRLSETNIQKQLDSPFLLSKTDGDIAKYFNKIINLDVIDRVLSKVETIKRDIKSNINRDNKEIEKIEIKLKKYEFIEDLENIYKKYESYSNKLENVETENKNISKQIVNYINFSKSLNVIVICINTLKEINNLYLKLDELKKEIYLLNNQIANVEKKDTYNLSKEIKLVENINNIGSYDLEMEELRKSIERYKDFTTSLDNNVKLIENCKRQLPNICPYCHSVLKI